MADLISSKFVFGLFNDPLAQQRSEVEGLEADAKAAEEKLQSYTLHPQTWMNRLKRTETRSDANGTYTVSVADSAAERQHVNEMHVRALQARMALNEAIKIQNLVDAARKEGTLAGTEKAIAAAMEVDPKILAKANAAGLLAIDKIQKAQKLIALAEYNKNLASKLLEAAQVLGYKRNAS